MHYTFISLDLFFTEEQQAGHLNPTQIPGDKTKDCWILQNQLLLMLKVQLRFQLLTQQDATKEESPIGSCGFIFFHSLCPALAAAKSSYKKVLTVYSPG